jgi:hypothetical protein
LLTTLNPQLVCSLVTLFFLILLEAKGCSMPHYVIAFSGCYFFSVIFKWRSFLVSYGSTGEIKVSSTVVCCTVLLVGFDHFRCLTVWLHDWHISMPDIFGIHWLKHQWSTNLEGIRKEHNHASFVKTGQWSPCIIQVFMSVQDVLVNWSAASLRMADVFTS